MKPRSERICDGTSREHADAERMVEVLMDYGGVIEDTQDAIAAKLELWCRLPDGYRRIDKSRFHRARNHLRDRVTIEGRPCCSYTVHYRRAGPASRLALIDPSGDLGEYAVAAAETLRGWVSRERQHQTETTRMTETIELLGDHVLAHSDRTGYRLLQRASIEIDRDGTLTAATLADLDTWLTGVR